MIWVYTITYNEGFFVKNFLAAYKDADKIIVYDNHSTDDTVELLKQDPRVEVRFYDSGNQIRDDLYLEIKNNVWKEARGIADWVIIVDFDEIFNHVTPDKTFDLDLSSLTDYNIVKPFAFNMVQGDAPLYESGHPFLYAQKGLQHPPNEKLCCFRPDQIKEINYVAGCHGATPVAYDKVKKYYGPEFVQLHYKCWNFEYYMKEMEHNAARLSDINRSVGWGTHYLNPLKYHSDQFRNGEILSKYIFDITYVHTE